MAGSMYESSNVFGEWRLVLDFVGSSVFVQKKHSEDGNGNASIAAFGIFSGKYSSQKPDRKTKTMLVGTGSFPFDPSTTGLFFSIWTYTGKCGRGTQYILV